MTRPTVDLSRFSNSKTFECVARSRKGVTTLTALQLDAAAPA